MKTALKILVFCLGLAVLGLVRVLFLTPSFEGSWQTSGGDQEFAWYIEYTFSWGTYSFYGYPAISGEGTYSIMAVEGDRYIVELRPHDEEGGEDSLADFRVSEDGETLDWGGSDYNRVK